MLRRSSVKSRRPVNSDITLPTYLTRRGRRKVMSHSEFLESSSAGAAIKPAYISHYGIRAQRYKEMIKWYKTVFGARIQHENEFLAFMTFDEEHHRLVIFEDAATVDKPATAAGVDHVGYGLANFGDLVLTYERLKAEGIAPFM